jgi:hypothetical protein
MKTFLKYICTLLETLCCLLHPFVRFEILLTKRHCNLAHLSLLLNDRYNLEVWKKVEQEEKYYPDYPVPRTSIKY